MDGMLGLARRTHSDTVVADYTKTTEEVLETTTIDMITKTVVGDPKSLARGCPSKADFAIVGPKLDCIPWRPQRELRLIEIVEPTD